MEEVKWNVYQYKGDANKCFAEIKTLETITPQNVLEYARNEDSELHKCFEWDDSIAAEKYRLEQAGAIIRSFVFVPRKKEAPTVRVLSLTTEKSTYQPTRLFVKNENEYENLLKRALAELEAFKRKYATLTELEAVFEQIDLLE